MSQSCDKSADKGRDGRIRRLETDVEVINYLYYA